MQRVLVVRVRKHEAAMAVATVLWGASTYWEEKTPKSVDEPQLMCSRFTERRDRQYIRRPPHGDSRVSDAILHGIISIETASCDPETPKTTVAPSSISWWRRTLASLHLASLPLPRRLLPGDPAFADGTLKRGLGRRKRDEQKLRALQSEAVAARDSHDPERIQRLFAQISEIAYGPGVTPQMREDFLARYGCTGWTEQVLDALVHLAGDRGVVEIGAGHGQWARALVERYEELMGEDRRRAFEFVLAYDDMTDLPLSPQIYHQHTQPAHDYFYSKVQKCKSVENTLKQWSCRGRVLLIVYPPPGNMALETVQTYVRMGPENDTVVYVGKGRGGANGNDKLFDYFEGGDWELTNVLPVQPPPGGKGYEKLYVLKRSNKASPISNDTDDDP